MSQEQVKTISGSIYDTYTTASQEYKENRMPRVGQHCEFEDGRKYVFCSSVVDITAGQVVAAPTDNAELSATMGAGAVAVGAKTVTFVLASIAANQLANGYLIVSLGTGTGITYRIKSNTASATVSSVANSVIVTLYDPIAVALAATDNVIVKQDRHIKVLVGTAALDNVGVAVMATTGATAQAWFWVQTAGVGYANGSDVAINLNLVVGAAGTLETKNADTEVVVARSCKGGATNGSALLCF